MGDLPLFDMRNTNNKLNVNDMQMIQISIFKNGKREYAEILLNEVILIVL